jgi:Gram-negative bacterial TonB protein C-terminal
MRYKLVLFAMFALLFTIGAKPQNPARVCVRHVSVPAHYPVLARQARLQGLVVAKLRIAADGSVAAAVVGAEDSVLTAHPLLQSETQQLVRTWTFECQSCAPDVPFEHVIKFNYRLDGEDAQYDDTRVTLELPDEVTIVARPPVCDHCPTPKKKNH